VGTGHVPSVRGLLFLNMKYNPKIHRKKSIRLAGFDYSSEALYFITICIKDKRCLFGYIENEKMCFTDIGRVAHDAMMKIPEHFPHATLHEFVIMPNHLHAIIEIKSPPVRTGHVPSPEYANYMRPPDLIPGPKPGSVPVIIQQYKATIKRWCNKNNRAYFEWQSRYHDHIIRSSDEYARIAFYIEDNPAKWQEDKFYL
jgi:putative transposase